MSLWKWDKQTGVASPATPDEHMAMFADPDSRTVARDYIEVGGVRLRVSTVFLGQDHNFNGGPSPLLFEVMVFCQEDVPPVGFQEAQWRYPTAEEARAGHAKAIEWAKNFGWLPRGTPA